MISAADQGICSSGASSTLLQNIWNNISSILTEADIKRYVFILRKLVFRRISLEHSSVLVSQIHEPICRLHESLVSELLILEKECGSASIGMAKHEDLAISSFLTIKCLEYALKPPTREDRTAIIQRISAGRRTAVKDVVEAASRVNVQDPYGSEMNRSNPVVITERDIYDSFILNESPNRIALVDQPALILRKRLARAMYNNPCNHVKLAGFEGDLRQNCELNPAVAEEAVLNYLLSKSCD